MSEVLRTQPNTSEELRNQRRNQLTFNVAELAVLSIINPMELAKIAEEDILTMALDPGLEIKTIRDDQLTLAA